MSNKPVKQHSPFDPPLPQTSHERLQWGRLYGCSSSLAIASAAEKVSGLLLIVSEDVQSASRLESELKFFLADERTPVLSFPDWETLPSLILWE